MTIKISKKQLEKLQNLDAILMDYNLSIRLVSFDDFDCCLQLHRINKLDPKTYTFSSIQLYYIYNYEVIKSYNSVYKCLKDLNILYDLFMYKKLKITK